MDKFIRLAVVTTGQDIEDRFNVRQRLRVVFNRALEAVGGGAHHVHFTLEYDDQVLDLERRIEDYVEQFGWEDGTVLELVPRPEVI